MTHLRWPFFFLLFAASCATQQACPSPPGGACDPNNANCPKNYSCALAELCTRTCEQTSDCWVKVEDGCRPVYFPGQRTPDGGVFVESTDDGFCAESKAMFCIDGFCQAEACGVDGGCEYDLYGPSEFKGNRSQGPNR